MQLQQVPLPVVRHILDLPVHSTLGCLCMLLLLVAAAAAKAAAAAPGASKVLAAVQVVPGRVSWPWRQLVWMWVMMSWCC
jgi:hypothetical protein